MLTLMRMLVNTGSRVRIRKGLRLVSGDDVPMDLCLDRRILRGGMIIAEMLEF